MTSTHATTWPVCEHARPRRSIVDIDRADPGEQRVYPFSSCQTANAIAIVRRNSRSRTRMRAATTRSALVRCEGVSDRSGVLVDVSAGQHVDDPFSGAALALVRIDDRVELRGRERARE